MDLINFLFRSVINFKNTVTFGLLDCCRQVLNENKKNRGNIWADFSGTYFLLNGTVPGQQAQDWNSTTSKFLAFLDKKPERWKQLLPNVLTEFNLKGGQHTAEFVQRRGNMSGYKVALQKGLRDEIDNAVL